MLLGIYPKKDGASDQRATAVAIFGADRRLGKARRVGGRSAGGSGKGQSRGGRRDNGHRHGRIEHGGLRGPCRPGKIGRAACRERVWPSVSISEGAVSLKKKK